MDWLNTNSGAVQALSTIVLVAITAWYAVRTHQMAETMKAQLDEAKRNREFEIEGLRAALIALIEHLAAVLRHLPTGEDLNSVKVAYAMQATTGELRNLIELVARAAPEHVIDANMAAQGFYWFAALARNGGAASDGSPDRGAFPKDEFVHLYGQTAECLHRIHRHLLGLPPDGVGIVTDGELPI